VWKQVAVGVVAGTVELMRMMLGVLIDGEELAVNVGCPDRVV
jgi:hypothetical protein